MVTQRAGKLNSVRMGCGKYFKKFHIHKNFKLVTTSVTHILSKYETELAVNFDTNGKNII